MDILTGGKKMTTQELYLQQIRDDIHGSTLTEALGNKLIHDLENGIITAGEVNK